MIDWATCTFDSDVQIASIVTGYRVFHYPTADDALLLVPNHCYTSSDHFEDRAAQMLTTGPDDFQITSAYLDGRNPYDGEVGPRWHEGRVEIDRNGQIQTWHQSPDGDWTKTGQNDIGHEDHFSELDMMTEIQYDEEMDLGRTYRGQLISQWRWIRDVDGGWHRPDDVLELQDGSNNDGEHARIDWAVDQDDGRFYFWHYVK
jgi:hypothetical protein